MFHPHLSFLKYYKYLKRSNIALKDTGFYVTEPFEESRNETNILCLITVNKLKADTEHRKSSSIMGKMNSFTFPVTKVFQQYEKRKGPNHLSNS